MVQKNPTIPTIHNPVAVVNLLTKMYGVQKILPQHKKQNAIVLVALFSCTHQTFERKVEIETIFNITYNH